MTQNNASTQKTPTQKASTASTKRKSKAASNDLAKKVPNKSAAAIATLKDAFIAELSDMRNAEQQLVKSLPKIAKAATNPDLIKIFDDHHGETEKQVALIDKAAQSCGIKLKRETCDAMQGLIKEGNEVIKNTDAGPVRDAMLISAGSKVEHYEIATYGCLVSTAEQLGFSQAVQFLNQILDQEKQAARNLTQIAERVLNSDAEMQDPTEKGSKTMARYDQDNRNGRSDRSTSRDEEGRFMSDNNRSSGRGYQYDDEDDRSSRSNVGRNQGSGNYRSSSRDDDDYDDRSSRSGNGRGWFGDSEGHAEAGRQSHGGGNSRSSSRDDDDYDNRSSRSGNYRSSSRDDDDDDRSSRSGNGRGWFGDSEGHAEAGRQSHGGGNSRSSSPDDDDDRSSRSSGGRGQGGNSRSSSRDDDDGRSSRSGGGRGQGGSSRSSSSRDSGSSSRSNQNDNQGSSRSGNGRGQGHGGWFGDPEGHAEAGRQSHGGRSGR